MSPPTDAPTKSAMITGPTLIVDKSKCVQNIQRMQQKAQNSHLNFRPHCKTHACLEIAQWLQEYGHVNGITVSSLSMAEYFATAIRDITVAFPLNVLEIPTRVQRLLSIPDMKLNLLVENVEAVQALAQYLSSTEDSSAATTSSTSSLGLFIKIDIGYGRTGIPAQEFDRIDEVVQEIATLVETTKGQKVHFAGFLTHAGHTYHCQGPAEVCEIYKQTTPLMLKLKELYLPKFPNLLLSMGDTPTCSIVDDMSAFDEMRPGNFVFYDLEQSSIGCCTWNDIAVAVACPIVAKHPQRREIVVYGGGVHCSKDRMVVVDETTKVSKTIFGRVARPKSSSSLEWGPVVDGMYVRSLSQEHGIIVVPESENLDDYKIGDFLFLLPVHSCMTADCLKHQGYLTTDGSHMERMKN